MDVRKRRLWRGDQIVALTPKAFDTLLALVRQSGKAVDKDDLLKIVWPDTFVSEETLTQNISTLRKALGDTSERPEYIATLPRRGYQFIGIVRPAAPATLTTQIPETPSDMPGLSTSPALSANKRERAWMAVACAAVIVSLAMAGAYYFRSSPSTPSVVSRWQVYPPPGTALASAGVLSPDGRHLAFVTTDQAGSRVLRVRDLASGDTPALSGTDGAAEPFWSPDSRSIAFRQTSKLKRVSLSDQGSRTVADLYGQNSAGAWGSGDVLVVPGMGKGPLYRVNANDGATRELTKLQAGENAHVWPSFLPDGHHFLYRAVGATLEQSGTYIGSLDSDERVRVLDGASSAAVYAAPGYLVFVREGALVAQRFEADSMRPPAGPLVTLAANVAAPDANGRAFSAAETGAITFVTGGTHDQLAWFERTGRQIRVLEGSTEFKSPALSPDDTQVLSMRLKSETDYEIWLSSAAGGTPSRVETGLLRSGQALWSPDGAKIAFSSGGSLYSMAVGSPGSRELLLKAEGPQTGATVHDWSHDGRFLVYMTSSVSTGTDLSLMTLATKKLTQILSSAARELQGQISTDCHWIAYTSDESGIPEVYVRSFPGMGPQQKVSTRGGAQPRWRRDGRELFYLSLDHALMSVAVHPESSKMFDTAVQLFRTNVIEDVLRRRDHYAVSSDGKRFLISTPKPLQPPITVLLNWTAALHPASEQHP
jgi:Tol biopolymer transport system component/DNA-binding winged helix-turn-helix (wHTH) protein